MLPSEQLKQQQSEQLQIAKENEARLKGEKKASAPKTTPKSDDAPSFTPDLTGGFDIGTLRFPANVMMANGMSSLGIGNHYSNSMSVSGEVTRLVVMPHGFVFIGVKTQTGLRWAVAFSTGMTAELP